MRGIVAGQVFRTRATGVKLLRLLVAMAIVKKERRSEEEEKKLLEMLE